MRLMDLNADLGEGFGPWAMGADTEMLDVVNSANIACGGHAGDAAVMFEVITMAKQRGVAIGAHPGFEDKQGFGRRRIPLTMLEIEQLIATQVGAIKGIAALANAEVAYVKPHGALNNWATVNKNVAESIVRSIKCSSPELAILAVSGTKLETAALASGLKTYSEIFADRGYNKDGTLVSRGDQGAMITDIEYAMSRLFHFFETGDMLTVCGDVVRLNAQSICIHGDSPHAVKMAVHIRNSLKANGFTLKPFSQK